MSDITIGYRKPHHTMIKGIWQVKIQGIIIGTNLTECMREIISGVELLNYYVIKKKCIAKEQIHNID